MAMEEILTYLSVTPLVISSGANTWHMAQIITDRVMMNIVSKIDSKKLIELLTDKTSIIINLA